MLDKLLAYVITNHRWLVAILFLMPASLAMNIIFYIRSKISFWMGSVSKRSAQQHAQRVSKIQAAIKDWIAKGRKNKLCTARPGWMAMSLRVGKYKNTFTGIPTNTLSNIIFVDQKKKTVFVEPNVTMGQITATLNPLGWTLPVLPELDDLTVGGLVCGVGVESSSHRHGLFQHTCKSFEVVLPNGEVVRCSQDENPDLFRAIPWSHGTIGFLVGAELEIVEAKKYVQLEYTPLYSKEEGVDACIDAANSDYDFVETLVFNDDEMVLMRGKMTNAAENDKINSIGLWFKPWFFTHVKSFLQKGKGIEYIPLRDYYHRHTRSIFWEIQDIITFGNQFWFRWLFGWMMPPHIAVLKRTQTEEIRKLYEQHHVVQDMLVPASKLKECLDVSKKEFDVFPLWICPMRIFKEDSGFIHPTSRGEEMFFDVGIYGVPQNKSFHFVESTKRVEHFVRDAEGFQMLYADMYQTREEFHKMFDHKHYNEIREKYGCVEAFPEVYDKVCKAARH